MRESASPALEHDRGYHHIMDINVSWLVPIYQPPRYNRYNILDSLFIFNMLHLVATITGRLGIILIQKKECISVYHRLINGVAPGRYIGRFIGNVEVKMCDDLATIINIARRNVSEKGMLV